MFDLLGERYQAAHQPPRARRGSSPGSAPARRPRASCARRPPCSNRSAPRPNSNRRGRSPNLPSPIQRAGEYLSAPGEADDVIVRRLVDAAVMPDLLAIETAAALSEAAGDDPAAVFVRSGADDIRVVATAACDAESARALARSAPAGASGAGGQVVDRTARPRRRRRAGGAGGVLRDRSGHADVAAPAHDRRRRPPGVRAVPLARPGRAAAGEPCADDAGRPHARLRLRQRRHGARRRADPAAAGATT